MVFGKFLAAAGLAALKIEARAIARRAAIKTTAGVLTGLLGIAAVAFGIAAFTVWLAGELGTIWALLIDAGIFLVLAALVQLVASLMLRGKRAPLTARMSAAVPPRPAAAASFDAAADTPPEPQKPALGTELGSVAVVALAGFLLAREMFRRRS